MTEDSSVQLNILLSCWILSLIGVTVLETIPGPVHLIIRYNRGILVVILRFLSLYTFLIVLAAGYQAIFIQLGLDQLFEAQSQYLGVCSLCYVDFLLRIILFLDKSFHVSVCQ